MNNNTRIRSKDMPAAERNRCLDFFKGIAAVCVVFVHIPFHGTFGKCISSIGSCGVMLFFLISGYYASVKETRCAESSGNVSAVTC